MTPAPWGRRHPEEYWSGCFKGVVIIFFGGIILMAVIQIVIAYWTQA